jgi:c-di-GMP-binding flagellar brake protein YcgR
MIPWQHKPPAQDPSPALPTPQAEGEVTLTVGDRLRLCLRDGSRLRARVTSSQGGELTLRLAAASQPAPGALAPPERVEVCLYREDAVYLSGATVLRRSEEGSLVLVLEAAPPQRLQRREYFRMPVRFSFLLRLRRRRPRGEEGRPAVEAPAAPAEEAHWALFALVNLSGGGCLCLDPQGQLRMDGVFEGRLHTGDDDPPLILRTAVVRRTKVRGEPAAGMRFVGLREKDRQRIMAALFREYRRVRARRARLAHESPAGTSPPSAD